MSRGDWLARWCERRPAQEAPATRKERGVDLVEWSLIADRQSERCWVAEYHALGWDAQTRRVRERLLVALYGPFSASQAEQIRRDGVDFRLLGEPGYWDLDAAERLPTDYIVLAHLGDDVLEPEERQVEDDEVL